MAGARNLNLISGLMAITNDPLELCIWNFVQRQITNTSTSVWHIFVH